MDVFRRVDIDRWAGVVLESRVLKQSWLQKSNLEKEPPANLTLT